MVDVFISYKREERAKGAELAERLRTLGFSVWWDVDILSGDAFVTEIYEVLKSSKVAIVLWCTRALRSRFVIGEALAALQMGKYVAATLETPLELPPPFNAVQAHDLQGWPDKEREFDRLFAAIQAK